MANRLLLALSAGALLAVSAFGQTTTTTTTTFTKTTSLAPVGLAIGETAEVDLVNTATATTGGTAASCTGSVAYYNSSGAIIGSATTFTLGTGQIGSVKLPYASAGASGSRAVVRAVITVTGTSKVPCALGVVQTTYDTATGVTHLFSSEGEMQGGFGR